MVSGWALLYAATVNIPVATSNGRVFQLIRSNGQQRHNHKLSLGQQHARRHCSTSTNYAWARKFVLEMTTVNWAFHKPHHSPSLCFHAARGSPILSGRVVSTTTRSPGTVRCLGSRPALK